MEHREPPADVAAGQVGIELGERLGGDERLVHDGAKAARRDIQVRPCGTAGPLGPAPGDVGPALRRRAPDLGGAGEQRLLDDRHAVARRLPERGGFDGHRPPPRWVQPGGHQRLLHRRARVGAVPVALGVVGVVQEAHGRAQQSRVDRPVGVGGEDRAWQRQEQPGSIS